MQWSIDIGTPLNGTDPSDAKACRLDDGGGVWGYLFPDEDQDGRLDRDAAAVSPGKSSQDVSVINYEQAAGW